MQREDPPQQVPCEPSAKLRHVSPGLRQEDAVVTDAVEATADKATTAQDDASKKEFMTMQMIGCFSKNDQTTASSLFIPYIQNTNVMTTAEMKHCKY